MGKSEERRATKTNTKMSARMNVNVTTKRALGRKLSGPSTRRIVTQAKIKPEAPVSERQFRQNLGFTEKDSACKARERTLPLCLASRSLASLLLSGWGIP